MAEVAEALAATDGTATEGFAPKPAAVGPRLLVVGCGPAGIQIVRNLAHDFHVILVEPKDYYEFTPGILRGLCDPEHLKTLHVSLSEALNGLPLEHMRGQVVALRDRSADVCFERGAGGSSGGSVVTVSFDYAVVAVGSQYAGSGLWKITGAPGEEDQTCLAGREAGLERTRQRLLGLRDSGGTAVLVGAGLVGVELAAELAHYMPGLRIVLADLATQVLPVLPESAQRYAHEWLTRHGVDLRLGTALPRGGTDAEIAQALGLEGEVMVLGCAGVSMRCGFMAPLGCIGARGEIRVNRALQVLTESPTDEDVALLGPERAEIGGKGRIFALGDCVSIEGLDAPLTKDIYPAEAMAEVVMNNLRLAPTVPCLRTSPEALWEMRTSLQQMTLCSLGPNDCIFVMNGWVLATGYIATNMKHQIEVTKMGQMRNQLWGSLVWRLVPHF